MSDDSEIDDIDATSDIDMVALKTCMDIGLRDKALAASINDSLDGRPPYVLPEPWLDVAKGVCSHLQTRALNLTTWQCAPCDVDGLAEDDEAQALLDKMLDAGLSRYEPDPIAALTKKRAKKATKRGATKPK